MIRFCGIILLMLAFTACDEKPSEEKGKVNEVKSKQEFDFKIKGTKERVDSTFTNGDHFISTYFDENTSEKIAIVKFHDNGHPYTDVRLKNGVKNGESFSYYDDGTLWSINTYENDVWHGPWKTFHSNGQVSLSAQYVHGKEDGEWLYYYPDGKLEKRFFYSNGARVGVWTTYSKDGRLLNEVDYSKK